MIPECRARRNTLSTGRCDQKWEKENVCLRYICLICYWPYNDISLFLHPTLCSKPPVQIYGVEGRYATALYSAASKQNKLDQVEKELLRVAVSPFHDKIPLEFSSFSCLIMLSCENCPRRKEMGRGKKLRPEIVAEVNTTCFPLSQFHTMSQHCLWRPRTEGGQVTPGIT